MSEITVSNVSKSYGAEPVLEDVSFRIERGDHASLVGSNGAGKSTLLRIVAGLEEPDAGRVSLTRGLRVAYLPQEPDFEAAATVYETMLDMFREIIDAQERLRVLELELARDHDSSVVEEYGRLQALVEHSGYDYRQQIERVLTGLGLDQSVWYARMDSLSGGQRTRANLARTLLRESDVLLLDEPTNHLDIAALEWLEAYLRDLKRAFLIVAHDRYLLDRVTRRTLELSFGRLSAYDAPYSRYIQLRDERMDRRRQEFETQNEEIARTEEFVRRFGAGQRSREARGRQKRLDRMERLERPPEEAEVHLNLNRAQRSGDIVLVAESLEAGYAGRPLVKLPEQVVVRRGDRIALIGPNGSGKTTLLRTLLETLPPVSGSVRWGSRTTRAYYSQTLEELHAGRTVLEEIERAKPMSEEEARSYLGRFLFTGDDVFKPVAVLSGGERSRVALAQLILESPNVLVLDEPTNHLDIASRDALQAVLAEYQGTLLFVSHDRHLIDSLANQLWAVEGDRLVRYQGTYSRYASGEATPIDASPPPASRSESWTSPAERTARLSLEAEALAARLAELAPTTAVQQLSELMDRYHEVQLMLQDSQDEWLNSVRQDLHTSSV